MRSEILALLLFISMFMLGCSYGDLFSSHIDYPEGEIFVESIIFRVGVIDVAEKNITNKEELVEYFNANYLPEPSPYPSDSCFLKAVIHGEDFAEDFSYTIHVNTLCSGTQVLANEMPIEMEYKGLANGYEVGGDKLLSKQKVILVKGNPDLWYDSSFQYNNETYTILPVSDGSQKDAKLNFTYRIERKLL